jgi:thiamine biosynthesis lipoprotein
MANRIYPTRRTALGLFGAALALPRKAFASDVETLSGAAFGTRWRVLVPLGKDLQSLRLGIEALFAEIDAQLSPWRTDSAISRFNKGIAAEQVAEPALLEVTDAALGLARRSRGAFDPTVGPLVARWGFGPIHSGGAPDWRGIIVRSEGLSKTKADLTLDLCGIAKGWALDRAAQLARGEGFDDLLFELGGEFVAIGRNPSGRDWRIGVEAPGAGFSTPAALRLPNGWAVATSGTQAQSYVLNGRVYGHIIDPRTQSPASGRLRSVTVVAENATTADGWATALFAAGEKAGIDLAREQEIAALFLLEDQGTVQQIETGLIPELLLWS